MTIRFGLGECNNVVSAPIELDRLKVKQMLRDLFTSPLLCFFSFSMRVCVFFFGFLNLGLAM